MTEGSFKNGKIESKDSNKNKRSVIGEAKLRDIQIGLSVWTIICIMIGYVIGTLV